MWEYSGFVYSFQDSDILFLAMPHVSSLWLLNRRLKTSAVLEHFKLSYSSLEWQNLKKWMPLIKAKRACCITFQRCTHVLSHLHTEEQLNNNRMLTLLQYIF